MVYIQNEMDHVRGSMLLDTFDDEDFVHENVKDLDNDDRQSVS